MTPTATSSDEPVVRAAPLRRGRRARGAWLLLLTVAVLVRGEAALATVLAVLARALRVGRPRSTAAPVPSLAVLGPVAQSEHVELGRVLATAGLRRGPPRRDRSVPLPV